MSRHRFVKKINIDGLTLSFLSNGANMLTPLLDELEDDALSDGGEDDLTPEQQG
jgi:hypothetical protein